MSFLEGLPEAGINLALTGCEQCIILVGHNKKVNRTDCDEVQRKQARGTRELESKENLGFC